MVPDESGIEYIRGDNIETNEGYFLYTKCKEDKEISEIYVVKMNDELRVCVE